MREGALDGTKACCWPPGWRYPQSWIRTSGS